MNWISLIRCFLCLSLLGFFIYQMRKILVVFCTHKHEKAMLKKRQAHELAILEKQMEKQKAEYEFKKDTLFPYEEKMKEIEKCMDSFPKEDKNKSNASI